MNIKGKKFFKNTIFFLLASLFSLNQEQRMIVWAENVPFDFSRPGSLDTTTISADVLLENIIGESLLPAEKNYLEKTSFSLKYEEKISPSNVSASYSNSTLILHADPYYYTDINQKTISWIPYQATLNSKTQTFQFDESQKYVCSFSEVQETDEFVHITYQASFQLAADSVNQLLNTAYSVADDYVSNHLIEKEEAKYAEAYEQYQQDLQLYQQYLIDLNQYETNLQNYQNYVLAKQLYDEQKNEYLNYLKEYEIYLEELNQYHEYTTNIDAYNNAVIAYQNYLIEKARYDEAYLSYQQKNEVYLKNMEMAQYQLDAMELIRTNMTSLNRNIYSAVMGSSVTEVLARKEDLIQLNASPEVIEEAEDATLALREIFSAYFSLSTDQDKYSYYKTNYQTIKKNLESLLRTLEKLYRSGLVSSALDKLEKTDKYLILIAQLAIVCNAIDDKPVYNYEGNKNPSNKDAALFDQNWKINGKTILEILENDVEFVDKDIAYPLVSGYPEKPEEPIEPPVVQEPISPDALTKPIEPEKVEDPGEEPIAVEEPEKPAVVTCPEELEPYVPDPDILALIDAYQQNQLVLREPLQEDYVLTMISSFDKQFKNQEIVSVEFYDQENQFIKKYETDYGSYIVYDAILPTKEADEKYQSYQFSHWEYADGEILDLSCVVKEGFVYPIFVGTTLQEYTITWMVDDRQYVEKYPYGSIPVFSGDLKKSYQGNYYYEFSSWDKELVCVDQDTTYRAIYDEKFLVSNDGIGAELSYSDDCITIDCSEFSTLTIQLDHLFDEVITDYSIYKIKIIHNNCELLLSSSMVLQLKKDRACFLDISIDDKGNGEYFYCIAILDQKKIQLSGTYSISALFRGAFDKNHSLLYMLSANEDEMNVRASIQNNSISFTLTGNSRYHIYPSYAITVSAIEQVSIKVSTSVAKYQEIVTFDIQLLVEGMQLDAIRIIDAAGQEIEFADHSFTMPDNDVYIIVSCKPCTYTVTFVSNDEIISSKIYQYGDIVMIPSTPLKASDENYSYRFIGWDKEITTVKEDVCYTAMFEQIPITREKPATKISIIKIAKIIGFSFIGILVVTLILIILKKKQILFAKNRKKI